MARPIKKGLDYFPLNVFLTGSVEYIECMYGAIGVYVIISLWKRIYEHSYYYKYDEKAPLICSKEFGNQLELCFPKKNKQSYEIYDEIAKKAVEFGVFDKGMFEKYSILTSKTIQKIYSEAKRKDANELIDERYLLISIPENRVFATKTKVIATKTPINAETIPQSKVKESKVKESKINKSKEDKSKSARKNGGYDEILSVVDDEDLKNLYYEFIKMRKLIKSPMTDRALTTLIDKVNTLEPSSIERQKKLLENSIVNNWKSVYPLKDNESKGSNIKSSKFNNYTSESKTDYAEMEEQILDSMLDGDYE